MEEWNIGVELDRRHPESGLEITRSAPRWRPFMRPASPLQAHAVGRLVPGWELDHGAAAPPPSSPAKGVGDFMDVWMVPYGCTTLRITEFPTLPLPRKRGAARPRTPMEKLLARMEKEIADDLPETD